MDIEWKAKIGYGDFISPICYANMQSFRRREHSTLWFHYKNKRNWKVNKRTPWTVFELANAIDNLAVQTDVACFHSFEDGFETNHINYDDSNVAHNFWLSEYHTLHQRDLIIVNTTLNNEIPMEQYSKHKIWKDPLGSNWTEFLKKLKKKYPNEAIIEIDYTTPIRKVHELYSRCKLAIGYHGSTMWMAKFLFCPMFIFSSSDITSFSFPWSYSTDNMEEFFEHSIDYWIESSQLFQNRFLNVAESYAPGCISWLRLD